jgi:DivIVA domain-containing protein
LGRAWRTDPHHSHDHHDKGAVVPLDPALIQGRKFRVVFRGYDVAAVDTFLDDVQAELTRLLADRDAKAAPAIHATAAEPSREPAAEPGAGDGDSSAGRALRTLVRAEQTAEQVIADAAGEAEELRVRARAEADEVLAAARRESGRLEAELQLRRQREVGALLLETQQLRAEIDRLSALERRYTEGMQAWLAEHQRALEQHVPIADAAPASPTTLRGDPLDPAA